MYNWTRCQDAQVRHKARTRRLVPEKPPVPSRTHMARPSWHFHNAESRPLPWLGGVNPSSTSCLTLLD
ncbi:hypothetical protein CCM_04084 [Cordyceps militaris CM01]|uniref:Uncharacterized protein n=1 Tax=Cordyceps militaris (strain CM01) TaxID=983644 RepID=G3JDN6_CORMM|nr:uncharacterized protein CCM_04084 [Cordyceps militaris CM01]EGX92711.1 hypothetical protein CCM_04084 [Cordyceps militaris CM01]